MTLSEELQWRGFIKDKTFENSDWLNTPRKFYLGSDPSSDSLTIGNLAIYMLARLLAKSGWRAVLLVGGATSLIGDPGGKDEERALKSIDEVKHNAAGIQAQVGQLFSGEPFELVNNYDWFKDVGYLEFLRDIGKHYSMTELIQRDFIAARMGEGGAGISYAEFSYSLIQGYDYWWLFKNKGVELQIGGSDQWGNMLSGVPLIRKKEGKDVQAMSMPLVVNKATGKKFGKSEGGAVWLDADKTSPSDFYQFWINVGDEDVEGFLKIYTELDKPTIDNVMQTHKQNPKERLAQKRLAAEVTKLVHGEEAAEQAKKTAQALAGASIDEAMVKRIPKDEACGDLATLLARVGLVESRSEARRLLESGGIYVNDVQTNKSALNPSDFKDNRVKLRRGKTLKNTVIVEASE